MFQLSDIKQTRVYQEVRQEGEARLLLRQFSKRFGKLSARRHPLGNRYIQAINHLELDQLDDLGEALLDFENISDLDRWLRGLAEKIIA